MGIHADHMSHVHAVSSWLCRAKVCFTAWDDEQLVLRFEYTVPARICGNPKVDGRMPLSAVLALVDECTTWASVAADPLKRPGVSISLEAQLLEHNQPALAGERLIFESRVQKVGRTVGFITCDVHSAQSGRHVARAHHTKYLYMGKAWDLAFGPAYSLTESVIVPMLSVDRPPPEIDVDDAEAFERLLQPTRVEQRSSSSNNSSTAETTTVAAFTCGEEHLQEVHVVFGGCHAMMHETAATLAAQGAAEDRRRRPHLASLRVNYIASASKGEELEAHVTTSARTNWNGESVSAVSQLVGAKKGGGGGAPTLRSEAKMDLVL